MAVMNDFLNNLSSPYWWISVFFVGLFINIFSSYFRDGIDRIMPPIFNRLKKANKNRKKEIIKKAKLIHENHSERIEFTNYENSVRHNLTFILLVFLIFMILLLEIGSLIDDKKVEFDLKLMVFTSLLISALPFLMIVGFTNIQNKLTFISEVKERLKRLKEKNKSPENGL